MKIITFFFFTLVVLSTGCFDGDRGVLTELLPAPAPPGAPVLTFEAEIPAGTGSELVISPIPVAVEEHLYGSWDAAVERLEEVLSEPPESVITLGGELRPGPQLSKFWEFCAVDWHRRKFYKKYIDAGGIAIIAPAWDTNQVGVADEFLYATREILLTMTSEMPALREVLSLEHGFRYVLVDARDVNMPHELRPLSGVLGFHGTARTGPDALRDVGGKAVVVIYEIYDGSDLSSEVLPVRTIVHEMAHAIDSAFDRHPHLFPDWGVRLTAAYKAASAKARRGEGYFDPTAYAMTQFAEYWAEGAAEWFTRLHGEGAYYELQRARMLREDPLLYGLLDEVFPAAHFPNYIRIAPQ